MVGVLGGSRQERATVSVMGISVSPVRHRTIRRCYRDEHRMEGGMDRSARKT